MADTITSAQTVKVQMEFADGDTRNISLNHATSATTAGQYLQAFVNAATASVTGGGTVLLGDMTGANCTGYTSAIFREKQTQKIDLTSQSV